MALSAWLNTITLPRVEDISVDVLDRAREAIAAKEVFAQELGHQLDESYTERHRRRLRAHLIHGADDKRLVGRAEDYSFIAQPHPFGNKEVVPPPGLFHRRILMFWAFTNFRTATQGAKGRQAQMDLEYRVSRAEHTRNSALHSIHTISSARKEEADVRGNETSTLEQVDDPSAHSLLASESWSKLFKKAREECEARRQSAGPGAALAEIAGRKSPSAPREVITQRPDCAPDSAGDVGRKRRSRWHVQSDAGPMKLEEGESKSSSPSNHVRRCSCVAAATQRACNRMLCGKTLAAWKYLIVERMSLMDGKRTLSSSSSSRARDERATVVSKLVAQQADVRTSCLLVQLMAEWAKYATGRRHRAWLLATAVAGMRRGSTLLLLKGVLHAWHRHWMHRTHSSNYCPRSKKTDVSLAHSHLLGAMFEREDECLLRKLLWLWRCSCSQRTARGMVVTQGGSAAAGWVEQSPRQLTPTEDAQLSLLNEPMTLPVLRASARPCVRGVEEVARRQAKQILEQAFGQWARVSCLLTPERRSLLAMCILKWQQVVERTKQEQKACALQQKCSRLESQLVSTCRSALESERERNMLKRQLATNERQEAKLAESNNGRLESLLCTSIARVEERQLRRERRGTSPRPQSARRAARDRGRVGISAFVDPKTQICNWEAFLAAMQDERLTLRMRY
mmetsp:Transcript_15507/g.35467  ORF Transcript_15507/g.35467 Transcript_15507/m.35467 type:complete len:681 (-) Transcript_15507:23-2065(-)